MSKLLSAAQRSLVRYRLLFIFLLNVFATFVSYVAALGLRFEFNSAEMLLSNRLVEPLALLTVARACSYIVYDLNQGFWRYVSTHEAVRLLKAHLLSTILFALAIFTLQIPSYPRSVIVIEFALSLLICGGLRFAVRLWCESFLPRSLKDGIPEEREVVILGAGDSGHLLVKNLLGHRKFPYRPIAVLDDSSRLWKTQVHGVPVIGPLNGLAKFLEENRKVIAVILSIPSLQRSRQRELEAICRGVGVPLKRLQSFEDIACLDGINEHTPLSIEGALEKEVDVAHEADIRQAISGRRVLITGAGGSIGSEIVRQVLSFFPQSLTLIDHSEVNLFNIEREVNGSFPQTKLRFALASICNPERLERIFIAERPEFVFHAAAYKHVPLVEDNSYEAFTNNICGTRNLLEVSDRHSVKRFVLISTDKAVDPSSLMGCSKRISELLVQQCGASSKEMQTAIVRFGNVINSAGSVIPYFRQQILSGGPLTVTHPEMERYFMSIREAVRLVLTAGTLGERGEVYILDMGRPIKILEVAQKMLALYGRRDIPISITGLRPGEKLKEVLLGEGESRAPTNFSKVHRVEVSVPEVRDVSEWISGLETILDAISDNELASRLFSFVLPRKITQALDVRNQQIDEEFPLTANV